MSIPLWIGGLSVELNGLCVLESIDNFGFMAYENVHRWVRAIWGDNHEEVISTVQTLLQERANRELAAIDWPLIFCKTKWWHRLAAISGATVTRVTLPLVQPFCQIPAVSHFLPVKSSPGFNFSPHGPFLQN